MVVSQFVRMRYKSAGGLIEPITDSFYLWSMLTMKFSGQFIRECALTTEGGTNKSVGGSLISSTHLWVGVTKFQVPIMGGGSQNQISRDLKIGI